MSKLYSIPCVIIFSVFIFVIILGLIARGSNRDRYESGLDYMKNERYEDARNVFLELKDYKDSNELLRECENWILYNKAIAAESSGNFVTAYQLFTQLQDWKDSGEFRRKCQLQIYDTMERGETYTRLKLTMDLLDTINEEILKDGEFQ